MTLEERRDAHARIDAQLKQMLRGCETRIAIGEALQVASVVGFLCGIVSLFANWSL
jgi:hypothetical protein